MPLSTYLTDPFIIVTAVAAVLAFAHLLLTALSVFGIRIARSQEHEEKVLREQLQSIFIHARVGTAELMKARARELSVLLRHIFDVGLDVALVVPHSKRSLHGQKP